MKKTLSIIALLAVAGLASTPAQAANRYISGLAGVSWFNDSDVESTNQPEGFKDTFTFDAGFTGVAALGCKNGNTRLEAEIGYQRNAIRSKVFYANFENGEGGLYGYDYSGSGKASIYSLMGNAFYDIPVGRGVEVYGMAGVGAAQVNVNMTVTENYYDGGSVPYASSLYNTYKAHETTFAYQFGAGVAVPISKGVKLDARYRYFAVTPFTIDTYQYGQLNVNASSSSVLLGLRVDL